MSGHWSKLVVLAALLSGGAAAGCQFLVTFETLPENTGGAGGSGGDGGTGAGTTGPTGGNGGTTNVPACVDPAADCGAPSGECRVFACEGGECVEGDVPDGGPAATQTLGDCATYVCMGGETSLQLDDTDVLDDGTECTVDSCNAGIPAAEPAALGTACTNGGGTVCDGAGTCVECNGDGDCLDPSAPLCFDGACVPATCADDSLNGDETDVDCGGQCVGCEIGGMCAGSDANCLSGYCDGTVCAAPKPDGDLCAGANECASALCVDGVCCDAACDGMCVACDVAGAAGICTPIPVGTDPGDECAAELTCDGAGGCTKDIGQACVANDECASGTCADTVCCSSQCSGICETCSRLGQEGFCTFFAAGTDPDNECPGVSSCNGSGICE